MGELNCKIAEMRKEAKRFYDQRREFNKMVDRMGREENLEDRLVEAAQNLNEFSPLSVNKPDDFCMFLGDAEAVLVFADWHYGMVTDNIWEQYNTQVCRYRVERLVERAVERIRLINARDFMSCCWATRLMAQYTPVRVLPPRS